MSRVLLEVAVDSFEDAIAAVQDGADRLELCSRLDVGGLTPSLDLFRRVRAAVSIPIVAMIRPRPGDFHYTGVELQDMLERIDAFRPFKFDGFVFGALDSGGTIDRITCAELLDRCSGIPAIFHRAWDEYPRTLADLESLIALGFARLLTSGGAAAAILGASHIRAWNDAAAGRIEILPGAGITPGNGIEILRATGCRQIHGTFKNCVHEVRAALDQFAGVGSSASG